MRPAIVLGALIAGIASGGAALAAQPPAPPPGRITGVGGIFVASPDPKALAKWYRDVLGVQVESWGGALFRSDAPGHPPVLAWNALPQGATYLAPSKRGFMIDFAVDDLDAFVARLKAKGVAILKEEDDGQTGKFAWILDPDGTKIELWQPQAH